MKEKKLFICCGSVLTLEEIVEMLKDAEIYEDEIYEAVLAKNNNRMCMAIDKSRHISDCKCGKACCMYKPMNGKFGRCTYNRKVKYLCGEQFLINQDGELTRTIKEKVWISASQGNRVYINTSKPKLSPSGTYWIGDTTEGFVRLSRPISKKLFPNVVLGNSPQEAEITIKIKQKQN